MIAGRPWQFPSVFVRRPIGFRWLAAFIGLSLTVGWAGCNRHDGGPNGELTWLVAASAAGPAEELARQFESQHPGVRVRVSAGASNALAQQIESGAPADLFLSANREWAESVERSGKALHSVDLLTNRLVLVVAPGNPAGLRSLLDLTSPSVSHVALAGENVPAGVYAQQTLQAAGVLENLRDTNRLVRAADVRAALVYVERGEAEAGIVYATDALSSKLVEVVCEIDPATHEAIVYPLVVLNGGANSGAKRELVAEFQRWLESAEGARVFEQAGFTAVGHER
ncbi:MAG: molybdate ABC transporter substrate-binding protein [Pirellulales bacterium]